MGREAGFEEKLQIFCACLNSCGSNTLAFRGMFEREGEKFFDGFCAAVQAWENISAKRMDEIDLRNKKMDGKNINRKLY